MKEQEDCTQGTNEMQRVWCRVFRATTGSYMEHHVKIDRCVGLNEMTGILVFAIEDFFGSEWELEDFCTEEKQGPDGRPVNLKEKTE